ncbi:MAG: hypothetical protein K5829_02310 [Treponema sp.]|nr:hypothetical protein [Treponema sp.]
MLTESEFEHIIQMITLNTGIVPKNSHRDSIRRYLEEELCQEIVDDDSFKFDEYIVENPKEIENLVNKVTVNETYFFREENQFKLLKEKIFPELRIISGGNVNIWSAACSSGEEIYSLALLAESCFLSANFIASDINTAMLEKCKNGIYGKNSIRSVDGAFFHDLLPQANEEGKILMKDSLKNKIDIRILNLSKLVKKEILKTNNSILHPNIYDNLIPYTDYDFPKKQHLVFIRNVFIYFDRETKAEILKSIVDNCMADGAYLFVSTNEIASFDSEIVPPNLKKCSDGNVYYFHKEVEE